MPCSLWGAESVGSEAGVTTTSKFVAGRVLSRGPLSGAPGHFRLFVLGGSFAMGSPYVTGQEPEPGQEGGIPTELQRALEARHPGRVEVINAASGGGDSNRVRAVAEQVLREQPDALLLMSCNNEGTLPPGRVRTRLQELGGYRLLQRLIRGAGEGDRPWYMPQDPDTDAIRAAFEANIRSIVDGARAQGIPVLLGTLPVNLRYIGLEPGHVLGGRDWPHLGHSCLLGIPGPGAGGLARGTGAAGALSGRVSRAYPSPHPRQLTRPGADGAGGAKRCPSSGTRGGPGGLCRSGGRGLLRRALR